VDATQPWGGGHLLPRGRLREPVQALRRAQVVVVTRADLVAEVALAELSQEIRHLAPECLVLQARHRPDYLVNAQGQKAPLQTIFGEKVLAFCGLAHPEGFWATLRSLGVHLVDARTFPDHHAYRPADLGRLYCWAARFDQAKYILTTRKDLVKIPEVQLAGKPLWALTVRMDIIRGAAELQERILQTVRGCRRLAA